MKQRFTIILAGLTLACFAGFAGCDDDEDANGTGTGTGAGTGTGTPSGSATGTPSGSATGTPSGSATGTTTGTGSGSADPCTIYDADSCELACCQLWVCIGEEADQCPGLQGISLEDFMEGEQSDGCVAGCVANPALKALIDPDDCATTVATIIAVNSDFEESCAEGGAGGAGGMGGAGGQ